MGTAYGNKPERNIDPGLKLPPSFVTMPKDEPKENRLLPHHWLTSSQWFRAMLSTSRFMTQQPSSTDSRIITFLRKRDYQFQRELGSGACGLTVLLYDDVINEYFVCKKYKPFVESKREELFENFVREIKLLHKLHHENVVRVFNYYLFPDQCSGYILMEYVEGQHIGDYVTKHPENINDLFLQAVNGFAYLELKSILHRDIRPGNILVDDTGVLKIIDLGFGKHINESEDFDKSISLNWWCPTPADFDDSRYDFTTEVYFVAKLFEKLIFDNNISHFKYTSALKRMCEHEPTNRTKSFANVDREIRNDQFVEFDFTYDEIQSYRDFANQLCSYLSQVDNELKYVDDTSRIIRQLETAFRSFMLEKIVPEPELVARCFFDGSYYYQRNIMISVACVRRFIRLLKTVTGEKQRLILANLHTRFNTIPRYTKPVPDDDIPF